MEEETVKESLRRLKANTLCFRQAALILAAVRIDLFNRIGREFTPVDDFKRTKQDRESVLRVCDALVSIDLLEKQDGAYRCTETASRFLTEQGSFDIRSLVRHFHEVYTMWADLDQALEEGPGIHAKQDEEELFPPEFMEAMETRATFAKAEIAEVLRDELGSGRLLDLGGGTGVFARAILRASPSATGVIADLPHVAKLARSYLEHEDLGERLSATTVHLLDDTSYGSDFDMVLISSILHMFGPEEIQTILARATGALNPGGRLVIRDYFLEEDRTSPTDAALFDLHMLLATESGGNYTESQYRSWLRENGLHSIRRIALEESTDDLLVAQK